ncbi:YbjQ family protein [Mucilaginibacter sp. Bleaf8]|uniref:YbjQ family protein n=1 Tax=Mucilaginibacter sp. Bleaf8 TaxID=2834430 RepID=UPI001BCF9BFC|nr:YbjQ family protein [Mucilaginibacter sp. Bleaf8]MBS7566109.1 YbjQ family protein [Mucilaginibacter sp. Bleaf8]
MIIPKNILVVTTSTIEGRTVKQHLKPVTAHLVAGTNIFSDILADFSDFFGGRSSSYQKQLTSLYNEAIDKIKLAAYELGANAVVGFSIDMDEISGKNKSMFMLTAIGTAVILEASTSRDLKPEFEGKLKNISSELIKTLQKKKDILDKASTNAHFELDNQTWNFVTQNKVKELFPFIVQKYLKRMVKMDKAAEDYKQWNNRITAFLNELPPNETTELLYTAVLAETDEPLSVGLCELIRKLQLFDFIYLSKLLQHTDFQKQKRALLIATFDKPYYNNDDIRSFELLKEDIVPRFKERGTYTTKKQMLSSKEKAIWVCECGKTNDVNSFNAPYCESCSKDIYGFARNEVSPEIAVKSINNKMMLISELTN